MISTIVQKVLKANTLAVIDAMLLTP